LGTGGASTITSAPLTFTRAAPSQAFFGDFGRSFRPAWSSSGPKSGRAEPSMLALKKASAKAWSPVVSARAARASAGL
jgi:hypothetical protein